MTWIKKLMIKFIAKKYLLGWLVEFYHFLEGKKTQLSITAFFVVWVGKVMGFIPPEIAEQLFALIGGTGTISLLEKFKRLDTKYGITKTAVKLREKALKEIEEEKKSKDK